LYGIDLVYKHLWRLVSVFVFWIGRRKLLSVEGYLVELFQESHWSLMVLFDHIGRFIVMLVKWTEFELIWECGSINWFLQFDVCLYYLTVLRLFVEVFIYLFIMHYCVWWFMYYFRAISYYFRLQPAYSTLGFKTSWEVYKSIMILIITNAGIIGR
jgi:hypothetical protein